MAKLILKGKKVILRTVRLSDAPRFVKWFNDPEVNKFLLVREMNLKDEIKWIKDQIKYNGKDRVHFSIDTIDGVHIGSCGISSIEKRNKKGGIGIMIGNKSYWNSGYGSEAMRILINFGFQKLKLHRIFLDVYEYNKRAIKVYKRLGFKTEGIMKEANYWNGKFWNTYNMAILKQEWKK